MTTFVLKIRETTAYYVDLNARDLAAAKREAHRIMNSKQKLADLTSNFEDYRILVSVTPKE